MKLKNHESNLNFHPERRGNVERKQKQQHSQHQICHQNIDIRNFSENFRSDVKTSQVATLYSTIMQASSEEFYATPNEIGVQYNFKSVYCI